MAESHHTGGHSPLHIWGSWASPAPASPFAHTLCHWASSSLFSPAMSFLFASIFIPQTLRFLLWVLTPCLPHMWTWGLYSWHTRTSSSQVISIEPEHIIQQSILVLAAFQNIKIQISNKLYMLVGKLQHPVGNPIWLLLRSFFSLLVINCIVWKYIELSSILV